MRVTLAIGLGLLLAANGFLMLADPAQWYAIVPGVPETGPQGYLRLQFPDEAEAVVDFRRQKGGIQGFEARRQR